MKYARSRKDSEKRKHVKGTQVDIAEVNAEDPVPIVPGEGNRNFDDPVTPEDDSSNKCDKNTPNS